MECESSASSVSNGSGGSPASPEPQKPTKKRGRAASGSTRRKIKTVKSAAAFFTSPWQGTGRRPTWPRDSAEVPFFHAAASSSLYEHQKSGRDFILQRNAVVMIQEMGMGKTAMLTAALMHRINAARLAGHAVTQLVIVPKSVKQSWVDELRRCVNHDEWKVACVVLGDGAPGGDFREQVLAGSWELVVASYDQLREDYVSTMDEACGQDLILPESLNITKHLQVDRLKLAVSNRQERHPDKSEDYRIDMQSPFAYVTGLLAGGRVGWAYATKWDSVSLDECHTICNAQIVIFRASAALQTDARYCLTGTPIRNVISDMYSLLCFVRHPNIPDPQQWRDLTESGKATRLEPACKSCVQWVTKDMIKGIQMVPLRMFHYRRAFITEQERRLYAYFHEQMGAVAREAEQYSGGVERAPDDRNIGTMQVLAAITRARQACCAAALTDKEEQPAELTALLEAEAPGGVDWQRLQSTKMVMLRTVVDKYMDKSEKCLVFSAFTGMLDICFEVLKDLNPVMLIGSMSSPEREVVIRTFNTDPRCRCMLISIKAGGVGLNLEAASRVFFPDRWWNYATDLQAMDRAHRPFTSKRPVTVTMLSIPGTVEDAILARAYVKKAISDQVYASTSLVDLLQKSAAGELLLTSGNGTNMSMRQLIDLALGRTPPEAVAAGALPLDRVELDEEAVYLEQLRLRQSLPEKYADQDGLIHSTEEFRDKLGILPVGSVLWNVRVDGELPATNVLTNKRTISCRMGTYLHWSGAFDACLDSFYVLSSNINNFPLSRKPWTGDQADAAASAEEAAQLFKALDELKSSLSISVRILRLDRELDRKQWATDRVMYGRIDRDQNVEALCTVITQFPVPFDPLLLLTRPRGTLPSFLLRSRSCNAFPAYGGSADDRGLKNWQDVPWGYTEGSVDLVSLDFAPYAMVSRALLALARDRIERGLDVATMCTTLMASQLINAPHKTDRVDKFVKPLRYLVMNRARTEIMAVLLSHLYTNGANTDPNRYSSLEVHDLSIRPDLQHTVVRSEITAAYSRILLNEIRVCPAPFERLYGPFAFVEHVAAELATGGMIYDGLRGRRYLAMLARPLNASRCARAFETEERNGICRTLLAGPNDMVSFMMVPEEREHEQQQQPEEGDSDCAIIDPPALQPPPHQQPLILPRLELRCSEPSP